MVRDFYQTLGVSRDASEKDIKQAYRRLAKRYHPDANKDDPRAEEQFKEVNTAYETLSDPEKRRLYDQFGPDYARYQAAGYNGSAGAGSPFGGMGGVNYTTTDFSGTPFEDIFESIFGGMGGFGRTRGEPEAAPTKGRDITQEVTITLREAYDGTQLYINKGQRRAKVNIPPGADTGTKVRVAGEGEPGTGGPGDLFLVIQVEPDAQFERDGDDLMVNVTVDAFTAMLGGEVRVPTMGRDVKLKIPPGTDSGRRFRLTGKGMPRLRQKDSYGDLYAQIQIHVPHSLNAEQRELVERLRRSFD